LKHEGASWIREGSLKLKGSKDLKGSELGAKLVCAPQARYRLSLNSLKTLSRLAQLPWSRFEPLSFNFLWRRKRWPLGVP
jgi:hypothetical protein